MILETTDKVALIKEKLKAARDRQKSYVDNRRNPLEFEVGDQVLLNVSPWKGAVRFEKKGKLAPSDTWYRIYRQGVLNFVGQREFKGNSVVMPDSTTQNGVSEEKEQDPYLQFAWKENQYEGFLVGVFSTSKALDVKFRNQKELKKTCTSNFLEDTNQNVAGKGPLGFLILII
ncbi:hypothetical protein Tco_1393849 [Tanacetum coccineum]